MPPSVLGCQTYIRPRVNLRRQNSMTLSQVKLLLLSVLLVNVVSTTPIHKYNEQLDLLITKPVPNEFEEELDTLRGRPVCEIGGPNGPYEDVFFWSFQQDKPQVFEFKVKESGSGQFVIDCEVLATENKLLCLLWTCFYVNLPIECLKYWKECTGKVHNLFLLIFFPFHYNCFLRLKHMSWQNAKSITERYKSVIFSASTQPISMTFVTSCLPVFLRHNITANCLFMRQT